MFQVLKKEFDRSRLCAVKKAFNSNEDGNIAIMFAFLLAVLMLFSGGAVDYTRYNSIRADITESLDAAALAMARYNEIGGPDIDGLELYSEERNTRVEEFGEKLFFENFSYDGAVQDLVVDFNITPQAITASADGKLKTLLLQVGRRLLNPTAPASETAALDMDVNVTITQAGRGRIELALVLDATGSMTNTASGSSQSKLEDLKDAVDALMAVMYGSSESSDNIRIGVVPFNQYVNPGAAETWDEDWEDKNAEAYYHGAHFFHVDGEGPVDTNSQTNLENPGNRGIARVVDVERKVSHYDLYNSVPEAEWGGCVEARPYPLDELDTPPVATSSSSVTDTFITDSIEIPSDLASVSSTEEFQYRTRTAFSRAPGLSLPASEIAKAENSRWVPFFHPDEPNCQSSACNWSGSTTTSYTMTNGVSRSLQISGWMFDDPDQGNNEGSYANRRFIDDHRYTHKNQGLDFKRYAEVVLGFRYAARNSKANLNDYWDDVKDLYEDRFLATDHGDDEYRIRNSYPGIWNEGTKKYEGKYDQSPSFTNTGKGPNRDCPAAILSTTDQRTDIETYMDNLTAYGNTNSAHGAVWGWRLLSPGAPFDSEIAYDDDQWQKAVVIMTDGENFVSDENTHWDSKMTAYGYSIEERMGSGVDRPHRGGAGFDSDRMADQIDEKLLRICYRMKQEGILVYTIVFGLNDTNTEKVFKACATEPSEPYYYKAPSGDQLEDAFGSIAADLVNLHISQ